MGEPVSEEPRKGLRKGEVAALRAENERLGRAMLDAQAGSDVPAPPPRKIAASKMFQADNINPTENTSLYSGTAGRAESDKCTMLQTALGIEVQGSRYNETILIPWVNICYVKYA